MGFFSDERRTRRQKALNELIKTNDRRDLSDVCMEPSLLKGLVTCYVQNYRVASLISAERRALVVEWEECLGRYSLTAWYLGT